MTSVSAATGSGVATYSVDANTGAARMGTIAIAGLTYTVNQAGTAVSGDVVLQVDGGTFNAFLGFGQQGADPALFLNRLTPSSYPAYAEERADLLWQPPDGAKGKHSHYRGCCQ